MKLFRDENEHLWLKTWKESLSWCRHIVRKDEIYLTKIDWFLYSSKIDEYKNKAKKEIYGLCEEYEELWHDKTAYAWTEVKEKMSERSERKKTYYTDPN